METRRDMLQPQPQPALQPQPQPQPPKFARYRSVRTSASKRVESKEPIPKGPLPQESIVKTNPLLAGGAIGPVSADHTVHGIASLDSANTTGITRAPSRYRRTKPDKPSVDISREVQRTKISDVLSYGTVIKPKDETSAYPHLPESSFVLGSKTQGKEPRSSDHTKDWEALNEAQRAAYEILNGGPHHDFIPRSEEREQHRREEARHRVERRPSMVTAAKRTGTKGRHVEARMDGSQRAHVGEGVNRQDLLGDRNITKTVPVEDHLITLESRTLEKSASHPRTTTTDRATLKDEPKLGSRARRTAASNEGNSFQGFDAPVSAVNSGERRVTVKSDSSSVILPVTPLTTVTDLLHAAADVLSTKTDTRTAVVMESYKKLGLERPLRGYEQVRDVMNSWDHDNQNKLLIVPPFSGGNIDDLENGLVQRPGNTSVVMYHSQKPETWEKRRVTLQSDGQVTVAKENGADAKNICHMSDFDMYIPTARQLKRLHPIRKICFAAKSQQKSAVFLNTLNFVHFFATNDKNTAATWYQAMQQWRSWYLVHIMGKGRKILSPELDPLEKPESPNQNEKISRTRGGSIVSLPHKANPSRPPNIRNTLSRPSSQENTDEENLLLTKRVRVRGPPPISYPKKLSKDQHNGTSTTHRHQPSLTPSSFPAASTKSPFQATGLLGLTYSQRQKGNFSTDHREAPDNNQTNSYALSKSALSRPNPPSLIDLTPQFQEAPQHTHHGRGRGIIPDTIPPGGLVEFASSPDVVGSIPPATTWRHPGATSSGETTHRPRTGTIRRHANNISKSGSTDPGKANVELSSSSIETADEAFTGGLLATVSSSQGDRVQGRGVVTGDRLARGPLLDVEMESIYVKGSLLAGVEQRRGWERDDGHVEHGDGRGYGYGYGYGGSGHADRGQDLRIDREKITEVIVSTGETR